MASNLRKTLITAGVLLAGAGISKVTYHEGKGSILRENPLVANYVDASVDVYDARKEFQSLPKHEKESFIPQDKRTDYSVAQAYSRAEKIHQRIKFAEGLADKLRTDEPAVETYSQEMNSRNVGLITAMGGLILALASSTIGPFRRR